MKKLASLLCIVALAAGCRRTALPSAKFEAARKRFESLYAQKLDDAYADPAIDEVVALLKAVPADSSDAASAAALLARIETGQKAAAESAAHKPPPPPTAPQLSETWASHWDRPDAGTTAAGTLPDPGSDAASFLASHGACLVPNRPFRTPDGKTQGDSYTLSDSPDCKKKFGELSGLYVMVAAGKIFQLAPIASTQIVKETLPADAGPANAADATP